MSCPLFYRKKEQAPIEAKVKIYYFSRRQNLITDNEYNLFINASVTLFFQVRQLLLIINLKLESFFLDSNSLARGIAQYRTGH